MSDLRQIPDLCGPLEVRYARELDRYERLELRDKRRYVSVWTR